jgi:6-pyruvoyltetrahydropterin/6-carboxytetrahydropterin synthase
MVVDFKEVKRIAQTWVDEHLDHKMLLHRDDPVVPLLQGVGEPLFLMNDNPTAENIAKLVFSVLGSLGLKPVCVTLWETDTGAASYSEGYYR